jgi:hypothetical protein
MQKCKEIITKKKKPGYFYKFKKKLALMEIFGSKNKTCPAKRGYLCP